MSSVIGEEVPSGHFSETLKDGVVLVKYEQRCASLTDSCEFIDL